ncbi:MAG: hypothetical protein LBH40_00125 [Alphaproteobacteria bacterium]|nr:hypothetical protein [Alphaproteobacteria bacterium]
MEIVISIRPEHLNNIRSGKKKWELRKRLPEDKILTGEIKKIWVWETSPVSKIVGYIESNKIEKGSPNELWNKHGKDFGVNKEFYNQYYQNKEYAVALKIDSWVACENANHTLAPQGYIYIKNSN